MCNICAINREIIAQIICILPLVTLWFSLILENNLLLIVYKYVIALDNKKRILVVDDELDICIVLKIVLENNGFIVDYYYNPVLALNEFKSNFYDLVILDIQMQDINGFQLYREIKKRELKAKICFLTASESLLDIEYKFSSVYTIIKKPIENNDLIKIVNSLLNNR